MTESPLLQAALRYLAGGLSLIPIGQNKKPLNRVLPVDSEAKPVWKPFQSKAADEATLRNWCAQPDLTGIAVVGGHVSGDLLIFDFDEPRLYEAWRAAVGPLADGLPTQRTGEGFQVAVRCDVPGPNQSLAWVPDEAEHTGRRIGIETRGEGGYALLPPSRHPNGRRYEAIAGDFSNIPRRSMVQAQLLLDACRNLDEAPHTRQELERASQAAIKPRQPVAAGAGVIDEWNRRVPIRAMLERAGYTPWRDRYTRPGGVSKGSVVVFDNLRSYHHSTDDPLHDQKHSHDSFGIYCQVEHGGDVQKAVKAAAAELGMQRPQGTADAGGSPPANGDARAPVFAPVNATELIEGFPDMRPSVIEGLLREGEVMNLVAPPKTRKSWLVNWLALSLAAGRPWLGLRTSGGKVLIVDAELHRETLARRLSAAQRASGIDQAILTANLEIWPVRGQRLTIDHLCQLLGTVERGTYRVIILDALYRFLPTDGEENSNETMTKVYNAVDALAERTRAAIVLVHHTTKGAQGGKTVTDVGAGGGAQSRAADTHLILRPHQVEGAIVVEAAVRSWKPFPAIVIRWTDPGWQLAPELDPADILKPKPRTRKAAKPDDEPAPQARVWSVDDFAREIVGIAPTIKDEIIERGRATGLSKSQTVSLFNRALDAKKVHRRLSGHGEKHRFSVEPPPQQPLSLAQGPGEGGLAHAPQPPEPHARGGMGGCARAPSPPPEGPDPNGVTPWRAT